MIFIDYIQWILSSQFRPFLSCISFHDILHMWERGGVTSAAKALWGQGSKSEHRVLPVLYWTNCTGLLIWSLYGSSASCGDSLVFLSSIKCHFPSVPCCLSAFHSASRSEQELTCIARTADSETSCEFVHDSCDESIMCAKLLAGRKPIQAKQISDIIIIISFSPGNPPQEKNCATSCPLPW